MKKYLTMSKSEYALILKLLLCTGLATAVSWTMGDVHNPTTAVTANLCLYVDRGYRGNLLYAVRRILTQLIQGALVLMLILPCKALALPVPDGVLILAACCFAILVGLPLNFKHTYAPLNCTLANATFIIARGSAAAREVQPISLPPFRAECGEDLALLSRLFEYVDAVHPSRQSVRSFPARPANIPRRGETFRTHSRFGQDRRAGCLSPARRHVRIQFLQAAQARG